MAIPDENKLDVWFEDDGDALTVQAVLTAYVEQIPGAQIYGISGAPHGINIMGHAPRVAIEGLIASQEMLGIRVVDHAEKGDAA